MAISRLLVAVVDDEECVRKALGRLLRSLGMEVETFACGQDFLYSLTRRLPDCVLLDRQLPGLSGPEVQQRISEARLRLPVIVVTGNDEPEVRKSVLLAGAVDYLLKPIDPTALVTAIRAAVSPARSAECRSGC